MISEEKKRVLELYAEGRKLYKLMQFEKAKDYFERALAVDPKDGPCIEYVKRCVEYIKEPPPEDWDGVFVMKTK
jgi:tetratricopeptide (TPR) repeat protein